MKLKFLKSILFKIKYFATEYDLGKLNYAYFDKDVANLWVSTGTDSKWNSGNKMRNDGVDIKECDDVVSNGFCVTSIEDGEWLQFTINSSYDKVYDIIVRYSNQKEGGKLYLTNENGEKISTDFILPFSNGNKKWKSAKLKKIKLNKGLNKVRVFFEKGNLDLNYLEFKPSK